MKNVLIIMLMTFSILLVGCSNEKDPYTEIKYDQLKEMLKNEETFILLIGSYNCGHCQDFKETLEKVKNNYNIEIKYIDTQRIYDENKNDNDKLNKMIVYQEESTMLLFEGAKTSSIIFEGTPTTIFIKNGEEESRYNRINGALSYEKVIEKLKKNGYIESN